MRARAGVLLLSLSGCGGDDSVSFGDTDGGGAAGSGGSAASSGNGGGPAGGAGTGGSGATGGSAGGGTGGASSGGAGGTSGGGTGGTAGGGAGGTSGGGGSSGAVTQGEGYVFVTQYESSTEVAVSFVAWPSPAHCTTRTIGPCRIDECDEHPMPATAPHAGRATVAVGAESWDLVPGPDGSYTALSIGQQIWSPGASVRIGTQGAEVPGIDATVPGPEEVTWLEPSLADPIVVVRTASMPVRWTGGTVGQAIAAFSGTLSSGRRLQIKCSFAAASGQGTIPAEALAPLEPGGSWVFVVLAEGYHAELVSGWWLRGAARTRSETQQQVAIQ